MGLLRKRGQGGAARRASRASLTSVRKALPQMRSRVGTSRHLATGVPLSDMHSTPRSPEVHGVACPIFEPVVPLAGHRIASRLRLMSRAPLGTYSPFRASAGSTRRTRRRQPAREQRDEEESEGGCCERERIGCPTDDDPSGDQLEAVTQDQPHDRPRRRANRGTYKAKKLKAPVLVAKLDRLSRDVALQLRPKGDQLLASRPAVAPKNGMVAGGGFVRFRTASLRPAA
jgi:hypothetical protein